MLLESPFFLYELFGTSAYSTRIPTSGHFTTGWFSSSSTRQHPHTDGFSAADVVDTAWSFGAY